MPFSNKAERVKYLGFDDFKLFFFGVLSLGFVIPITFSTYDWLHNENFEAYVWDYLEALIFATTMWLGVRWFILFIRQRLPEFKYTRRRIVYQVIFVVVYGAIAGNIVHYILEVLLNFPPKQNYEPIQGFIASYFVTFFFLSIYEGIFLYQQNQRNLLKQETLKQEHIKSELQGLRNQVNPHFLFNSMNTLMNIIHEDKDLATSFLKKLSDVYRYILEKREHHLITLKEELKFIESYVFLQKERFKNNLNVHIEISDYHLEKYLLPLSLQILFENAIKHNVISSKYPLTIEVYVDANHNLVVKNNLRPKNQQMPSTGVGLQNIKSRFAYFSDKPVDVISEGQAFIVRIPLIDEKKY